MGLFGSKKPAPAPAKKPETKAAPAKPAKDDFVGGTVTKKLGLKNIDAAALEASIASKATYDVKLEDGKYYLYAGDSKIGELTKTKFLGEHMDDMAEVELTLKVEITFDL